MKKIFFIALTFALVAIAQASDRDERRASTPGGDATPRQADADATQDVLYLGVGRPALLRFHLRVEDKSVFARWDSWMNRLFRSLDRNESGGLDRVEGGKVPSVQQVIQFFQGNLTIFRGQAALPSVPFNQLDADRDGKITLEEMCNYYRKNGAGPVLTLAGNASANTQDNLTDTIFNILDTNKDGKLSEQELRAAEKVLARYDTSDDELVSPAELGGQPNLGFTGQVAAVRFNPATPVPSSTMMLVPRDEGARKTNRAQLAREVIARLDKDKSGKLSLAESGFPRAMFDTLDRNKDEQLDVLELNRWIGGKPDGEFTISLKAGRGAVRTARAVEVPLVRPGSSPATGEARSITLENVRLTVMPTNVTVPPIANVARFMLQQFRQVDRDKKGFLVKKQLDMQMHFYLVSIFDMADRNGDGKLTEEEIKEYTDLFQDAHGAQVSLSLTSTGRGLFQTLDTNGDGQLSIREMRNSWDRVKEFDRDTDSAIGRNEFPQQFTLSVSTGMNYNVVPPVAFAGTRPAGTMRTPARGPTWFRKMDRNGDGDVSQLEWLGSKEAFARIDTDKDNLISPSEAEAFDAKMRDKE